MFYNFNITSILQFAFLTLTNDLFCFVWDRVLLESPGWLGARCNCTAEAGLNLVILLPWALECWQYRYEPLTVISESLKTLMCMIHMKKCAYHRGTVWWPSQTESPQVTSDQQVFPAPLCSSSCHCFLFLLFRDVPAGSQNFAWLNDSMRLYAPEETVPCLLPGWSQRQRPWPQRRVWGQTRSRSRDIQGWKRLWKEAITKVSNNLSSRPRMQIQTSKQSSIVSFWLCGCFM